VSEALRLRGLRARLVVAIMIVAVAVLTGSFIALGKVTGSDLRGAIDAHLQTDLSEFETSSAARAATPAQLRRRAQGFVRGQSYHPDSRIFAISVSGDGMVSNRQVLLSRELGERQDGHGEGLDDGGAALGLLDAPPGLSTVGSGDDQLRVLTQPIGTPPETLGTFRVAESLEQVDVAEGSLADTLLIVGALSLAALLGAAFWIATVVARPLTRIAGFASDVDTAGLDSRLAMNRGPEEVISLADSLNRMLDRLQRSFEREREFVADASHELRTPLTIAHGELELLSRDLAPEERERLAVVRRELERMERLISAMLTLASAEDAGAALRREPIPIVDLLTDLRRDLPLLGPREYRVAELDGTLQGDPDRLVQVFRNLVANAVAHTGADGVIEVRAEAADDRVRFTVNDDGPGVAAEEVEHLFDRFHRASEGRVRDRSGSGLGLAIARAIVEAHGGTIGARNAAPRGFEVWFEIPGYRP
jgi:signal transduction histidine kinase